jgi:hypothetical protein
MDIPSKHLDDAIAYTIEAQTAVTPAQKDRAWAKLQQKAAQQVILAPYAVPPRIQKRQTPVIEVLIGWIRSGIYLLVTDETMYQRAAHRRNTLHMHRIPYATVTVAGTQQVLRFHMSDILRYGLL